MSSTTTYLISGTTRGIGRGQHHHLCWSAQDLLALPKGPNSTIFLVKLNATSETDAKNAISSIQQDHNINHLDIVIANAGILSTMSPVSNVTLDSIREHFEVNTLGPISLFQAALPLLQKSAAPKFVVTTSAIGSITLAPSIPAPVAAYGVSKAAVNWFFSRAHGECEDVVFVIIHPGLVETEMSGGFMEYAVGDGRFEAIGVKESVEGYLNVVDRATREGEGGRFVKWDGEGLPW